MSSMLHPRAWRVGVVVVVLAVAWGTVLAAAPPAQGSEVPAAPRGQGTGVPASPVSGALDVSDGGHAALIEVLRRKGRPVPADLIADARQTAARITPAELAFRSAQAGLPAVILPIPVSCVRRALDTLPLPAIAVVGSRYVVIDSRPQGAFATLIDPRAGRVRTPLATLDRDWKETVVTFGVTDKPPVVPCS